MQLLFFHGTFCPPCESTKKAAEQFAERLDGVIVGTIGAGA